MDDSLSVREEPSYCRPLTCADHWQRALAKSAGRTGMRGVMSAEPRPCLAYR